ncbi:hypothetical protein CXG81DRAFT_5678, partial [Caulochytrium protostelioides]
GLPAAHFTLATCYLNGIGTATDPARALHHAAVAADAPHAASLNLLGMMFDTGVGTPVDRARALQCYIRAARDHSAAAMYNIAMHYTSAWVLDFDPRMAAEWFARAAMFGSLAARVELGYLHRDATPPDAAEAARQFGLAAFGGEPRAQREYARCLLLGEGLARNALRAQLYLQRAA